MHSEIAAYLASVPAHRAKSLAQIHDLIMSEFPQATESMEYKMPTYKIGDNWLAIANQKAHISFYTCDPALIQPYLDQHPNIRAGKGCLRFRDTQTVDLPTLRTVVRLALTKDKSQQPS